MNRRRLKFIVRLAFASVIGLVGIAAFVFLGRAMASITSDEEATEVFNEAATLPSDLRGSVEWLPDADDLPRPMEPLTRELIGDAWLRGWSQLAILATTGETVGVHEYFSNSAKQALLDSRTGWQGLPTHQIGHELQLQFYSEDGSVASMTSTSSRFLRRLPSTDGETTWFDADEAFDAVLLLEDGNWRMQHLVRRSADGVWWSERPPPATDPVRGDVVALDYLPQDVASNELFAPEQELDWNAVDVDMERMKRLGANTIRVPLHFDSVGGRRTSAASLAAVTDMLDGAGEAGLAVIVSLFDGRHDHRVLNWDADDDHLAVVVAEVGDHPALAMWELQHNVDLTVGVMDVERTIVDAWIGHVARTLRSLDADTPMTVSWSTARAAIESPHFADAITLRSPGDPAELPELVADLRRRHGDVPILVDGPGMHTYNSVFPGGSTAKEQAATTAALLEAARTLEVAGVVIAPLWDVSRAPSGANPRPWVTGPTLQAGIVTAEGLEKPAATLIGANVNFLAVAKPTLADDMKKPFNLIALAVCLGSLLLSGLFGWRSRGLKRGRSASIKSPEEIDLQSQKKHANDSPAAAGESGSLPPTMSPSEQSSSEQSSSAAKPAAAKPKPTAKPRPTAKQSATPPPGIVPGKPVVSRPAPTPEALNKRANQPAAPTVATDSGPINPPLLKPPVLEAPPLPPVNSGIAPAGTAPALKPPSTTPPAASASSPLAPPAMKPPTIKPPSIKPPTIVSPPVPPPISGMAPPPLSAPPNEPKKLVPSPPTRPGKSAGNPPASAKADTKGAGVDLPPGVPKPKFVPPAPKPDGPKPDGPMPDGANVSGLKAEATKPTAPKAETTKPPMTAPPMPTKPAAPKADATKAPMTAPPTIPTPMAPPPMPTKPAAPAAKTDQQVKADATTPTANVVPTPPAPASPKLTPASKAAPPPAPASPNIAPAPKGPTPPSADLPKTVPTPGPKTAAPAPAVTRPASPATPATSTSPATPATPAVDVGPTAPPNVPASPMRPPAMKPPKMIRPDAAAAAAAAAPTVTPSTPAGPPPMAAVVPPAVAATPPAQPAPMTAVIPPATPQPQTAAAPTGLPIDLANITQVMQMHGAAFQQRSGAPLTPMPFIERAVCDALLNYPIVNGNHQKIHLAVQPAFAEAPGVIADADYKTLRILALETSFPGPPEVAPTFTLVEGRPSRSIVDTMGTSLGLVYEGDTGGAPRISLVSKMPNLVSAIDTDAFLQRIKSTLETHDWHGEMH